MLSVHAASVIAFMTDGAVYHTGCMQDEIDRIAEIQEERQEHDGGVGYLRPNFWDLWAKEYPEITPLSRYEIDTWASENDIQEVEYYLSVYDNQDELTVEGIVTCDGCMEEIS